MVEAIFGGVMLWNCGGRRVRGLSDGLRNFLFYFLPVCSVSGRVVCRWFLWGVDLGVECDRLDFHQHRRRNKLLQLLYSTLERDDHVRILPRRGGASGQTPNHEQGTGGAGASADRHVDK